MVSCVDHVIGGVQIQRRSSHDTRLCIVGGSRVGHVIGGVEIQRRSLLKTRLCIGKVEIRHHLCHLDTKAVLAQDSSLYCWWLHVEAT